MPQCPSNPHFYSWLKELRDDAREKDNKSYHCYSRAMKALCSYPIPLRSGEEAKSIQHIGDKIARILDKKTRELYKERGYRDAEIEHFMISCSLEKLPTVKETMKKDFVSKNRKRKKLSPPISPPHTKSTAKTIDQELDNIMQQIDRESRQISARISGSTVEEENGSSKRKCNREEKQSPTHYREITNFTPVPIKVEVKEESEEFVPVTILDPSIPANSKKRSPSPARPSSPRASPARVSPARISPDFPPSTSSAPIDDYRPPSPTSDIPDIPDSPDSPPIVSWSPTPECSILEDTSDPGLEEPPPGEWRFAYLDENNMETLIRNRAVFLDSHDMTGLWLKVKTYSSTMEKCDKLFVESEDQNINSDPRYKIIHVEVSYCPLRAPGLPKLKALKQKKGPSKTQTVIDEVMTNSEVANIGDQKLDSLSHEKQGPSSNKRHIPDISDSEDDMENSWFDDDKLSQAISGVLKPPPDAPWIKNKAKTSSSGKEPRSRQRKPSIEVFEPVPVLTDSSKINGNRHNCYQPEVQDSSKINGNRLNCYQPEVQDLRTRCGVTNKTSNNPTPTNSCPVKTAPILFKMAPNSFKVQLCVDNAEVNSKKQQLLLKELEKNGVDYNVRKLQVGDFLWRAVDDQERELVLDVVVERKRLDDLAQSITGGRFTEQKMRLKTCGLSQRVYLVETKAKYLSLPEQSLNQAVVNTQVIDKFTIKKTQDIKETAAYLTMLTRYLDRKYRGSELSAIEEPTCTSQNRLLTFQAFSEHSVKNRVFSVGEVWLKQLARIPKISQDKAEAIVQVFPTLKKMKETAENMSNKDEIVSNIRFGPAMRKIGIAASRMVAGIFSDSPLH